MNSIRIYASQIIQQQKIDIDFHKKDNNTSVFYEIWKLYIRQLIRQDSNVGLTHNFFFSAQSAHDFFNEENYIESVINMSIVRAVPSALTGLGILGTFLGLAAGIHSADQFTREGLMPLLNGAGLAFYTSICGLLCSLAVSVIDKIILFKISNSCTVTADQLDNFFPVVNRKDADYQSLKILQQIEGSVGNHLEELNKSFQVLTNSLVEQFTIRLSEKIEEMGEKFNLAVSGSAEKLAQSSETFENTVNDARIRLFEGVTEVNNSVQTVVNNVEAANVRMQEKLIELTECISTTSNNVIKNNQLSLQSIEKITQTLTETANQLSEQNSSWFTNASESLTNASKIITDHFIEENAKFTEKINIGISEVIDRLQAASSESLKSFKELSSAVESSASEVKRIQLDFFDKIQQATHQTSSELSSSVSAAARDLTDNIHECVLSSTKGISQNFENVHKLSSELEDKMRQLTDIEMSGRRELENKLREIQHVASVLTSIKDLVEPVAESAKSIQQGEAALHNVLNESTAATSQIALTTKEVTENLEKMREHVNTMISESDLKLANIVTLLNQTVTSWNEEQSNNAKSLLDAVENLRHKK